MKVWVERGRKFKSLMKNSTDRFFISLAGFGQKRNTNSIPVAENFTLAEQFVFSVENSALKTDHSKPL